MRLPRLMSFLFLACLLSACLGSPAPPTPAPTASPSPISSPVPSQTPSPTLTPLPSPSPLPSRTPFPSLTPLPIPTAAPAPLFQYAAWELVHALAWSPRGERLAVALGQQVMIYETAAWEPVHTLECGGWAVDLAFHPGGDTLALVTREGILQTWQLSQGERLCQVRAHHTAANSLAFRADGEQLVTSGNDGFARIWDSADLWSAGCDPQPRVELIGASFGVPDAAFSPDGSLLASIDSHMVRLRDPQTRRLIYGLEGQAALYSLAFSPDGSTLAAGEMGNTLRLWEVQGGAEVLALSLPGQADAFLWRVAFSPDGRWLAAGSSDGSLALWEAESGALAWAVQAHGAAVSALAFSPDGRWLASGGLDAAVYLWEVSSP